MKRRQFLKLSAASCAALASVQLGKEGGFFKPATALASSGSGLPGSLGAKEVPSVCDMCFWRCPIVAKVKDGRLVKIEGNPKSPLNGTKVCARGNAGIQLLYDPDRMKYPMKRVGGRGEGKWARISWDEALDEVAHNLKKVRDKYGPHALAFFDHGATSEFHRAIFKALGTENYSNEPAFFQCVGPVAVAYMSTMGYLVSGTRQYIDMANAKAMLLVASHIGENLHVSHTKEYAEGLAKGAKLVVVDPRFSAPANKADIWLPIRPGTDTALLLAWINYVIQHDLYDKEFVHKNCNGFEQVKKAVKGYSMEWAARICDLNVRDMEAAIRIIAENRPNVSIHPGRHSTWYGRGDTQRHRALAILTALFGAVGVPGGLYFPTPVHLAHTDCLEIEGEEVEGPEESLKDNYPFADPFPGTPTGEIVKATLTGKPYPIKLWGVCGVNIMQTIPNPYQTMEAVKKLDFIFSIEMLPTETAIWSDIVLPEAVYLERYDGVYAYDGINSYVTVRQPVVEPMFEAKPPFWIANELAKRIGLKGFSCKKEEDFINAELKGLGLSIEKLMQQGGIVSLKEKPYRDTSKPVKFPTESGKIELALEAFADEDFDAVPKFEPTPAPPKGFARLLYGRVPVHTLSRTMNNLWLNHEWPENHIWLNDKVAAKLGIKDGEEVVMENQHGYRSMPIKVKVTPGIRPDCVYVPHGFGSRSKHLSKTFGKGASDQFMITEYEADPFMGASSHRTSFVRLVKGDKVLDIPELVALPRELPRYQVKKAS